MFFIRIKQIWLTTKTGARSTIKARKAILKTSGAVICNIIIIKGNWAALQTSVILLIVSAWDTVLTLCVCWSSALLTKEVTIFAKIG